jgi:hypothetical protein
MDSGVHLDHTTHQVACQFAPPLTIRPVKTNVALDERIAKEAKPTLVSTTAGDGVAVAVVLAVAAAAAAV